ncbi:hypothetical protein [Okeania sp.]|uniref:hypothetical protein n=1 Tax=Okeania sp. TaxID=3100323 RepID=UPI002B4B7217|nr:hypothetical protein [Okeania sp.]MEB3341823.1 hypothetical protein [Okeania sp.]
MDRRYSRIERSPPGSLCYFLRKKPELNQKSRDEQMAKALEKLAEIKAFANNVNSVG